MMRALKEILGSTPVMITWPIATDQFSLFESSNPIRNIQDDCRAAFLKAAAKGDANHVAHCLENQLLDVNVVDINGMSALIRAVQEEQLSVVAILLKHKEIDVNIKDNAGHAALHYAVKSRNCMLTTWLLMKSCDEDIKNMALTTAFSKFCQSQLHPDEGIRIQACRLYEELISRLLNHGANADIGGLYEYAQHYPRLSAIMERHSTKQMKAISLA